MTPERMAEARMHGAGRAREIEAAQYREPTFGYDRLAPESVTADAIEAARDDRLVPIISEYDGGIIAYALRGHEVALTAALNVPAAEVEYRQRQRDEDRRTDR